ncbi:PAS domain-containing protein [Methylobacterium organophilum]|uniref:histidine kinase dimerization/phosphoacceptor domain -containing protein n=1 Tax=Methylobacterium organophilum TaxID=410 RepID=UPI001F1448C7|nr:histidine kinase dimerization/phosphoacceptor domain -containing protein [Methylobacterium organophilum]UMY20025.1 PAS domain-containing protein [Methylobacterium organophilum]
MVVTDPRQADNPIVWANEAFLALTGYGRAELYGRNCRVLQGPDSDPAVIAAMRAAVAEEKSVECELFNVRKDGARFWNGMTISPVRDPDGTVRYFFSAQADMTDKHRLEEALKRANDELERQVVERTAALQAALEQKTALLHEVDHRVKNNLQVISSLMLLKARRTPEGEAREALQAMAERIGALSTAHRMLYSAGNVSRFDFQEFTAEFLSDVAAGLDPERTTIRSEIEPVGTTAAMAAPLALMLHELTANALRHAFPGDREGLVSIRARQGAEGMQLVVEDDGVGLAQAPANPAGFGRNLVEMVVRQLRGHVLWSDAAPGTRVEITIPMNARDGLN